MLDFETLPQQMVFVDPSTSPPAPVDPSALVPNRTYDVFIVLRNTDNFEHLNVQVTVTHSAFGIGLPAGTSGIIEPLPVDVPPRSYGNVPGLATVHFHFTAPQGGHGCLFAKIEPNGPQLQQNITVFNATLGTSSYSLLVFGGAAQEQMILSLIEYVQGGPVVPVSPAQSWHPLLIPPAGTGAPSVPTPAPVTLNLAPNAVYSVGLQVSIPANATGAHVFRITGTVGGAVQGLVDIVVSAQGGPPAPPPDPFVIGGYQSADILLFDPSGHFVPLGGAPGGPWDTLLRPNTDYGFHAVVHNDSPTPAVNTVVRFWRFSGGLTLTGQFVDVESVTVGGNTSLEVRSDHPFHSAPPGQHACAIVSIYNAQSTLCNVDPSTAAGLLPTHPGAKSATAWRNTDSMWVYLHRPWNVILAVDRWPHPDPGPVRVEFEARYAPQVWLQGNQVEALRAELYKAGAQLTMAPYLVPSLRETLDRVNLDIKLTPYKTTSRIEAASGGKAHLVHALQDNGYFEMSGQVPPQAKPGDVYIVTVAAHYPTAAGQKEQIVEFTEVLHVREG